MVYVAAFLIGIVAGLRAMTAPALASWAARLGWLKVQGTPVAWMGAAVTPWIFTLAAIAELVNDKLPKTGSRKAPPQFLARILMGALSGATVGAGGGSWVGGLIVGSIGAVVGTFGGYELRSRVARAIGRDLPAALIEDVIAIGIGFWAVCALH